MKLPFFLLTLLTELTLLVLYHRRGIIATWRRKLLAFALFLACLMGFYALWRGFGEVILHALISLTVLLIVLAGCVRLYHTIIGRPQEGDW